MKQTAEEFCRYMWHIYLEERAYDALAAVLDPAVTIIGTGKHEFHRTMQDFVTSMSTEAACWDGSFIIEKEWYQSQPLSDTYTLVIGEIEGKEDAKEPIIYDFHFRFTVIMKDTSEGWKLLHVHQSVADINQGSDEFFPKRLIKQSNEQLREKIAEKTRELQKSHEAVLYYSQHDYLSKLYNRYYAETRIKEAMEKQTEGTMMLLDVDNFKQYNDTYGHPTGDQLLIALGKALKDSFPEAILARYGGDEFVVYLTQAFSQQDCTERMDAFFSIWKQHQQDIAHLRTVTLSVGIAQYPQTAKTYLDMYHAVDHAMYQAKQSKQGNSWIVASSIA